MKKKRTVAPAVVLCALSLGLFCVLAGDAKLAPSAFEGKTPKEAAEALLKVAEAQAEDGTWELIGAGRVFYLSGEKEKGQALFDKATALKSGPSEWRRIGKVYAEAGDYEKAVEALEKAVAMKAEETTLTELGVMHNLSGKRDKAEENFRKAIQKDSGDVWDTIDMAGSYVGVKPQS